MRKNWSDEAWEDYLHWQKQDKKTLRRINELIFEKRNNVASVHYTPPPKLKVTPAQLQGQWKRDARQAVFMFKDDRGSWGGEVPHTKGFFRINGDNLMIFVDENSLMPGLVGTDFRYTLDDNTLTLVQYISTRNKEVNPMKCPYYNEYGHECKLYGTKQDYQRQTYCENRNNLSHCANYEEARKTNNPRL